MVNKFTQAGEKNNMTESSKRVARLYHSSISELGHSDGIRNASDKHNLRADPDNKNVIHSKTKNNLLVIDGERADPMNGETNYKLVKSICDALKRDFVDTANQNDQNVSLSNQRKAELIQDRTLLKSKIKKWSENPKAEQNEREFWQNIHERLGSEALNGEDLANELQSFGKSVKRFNDKKRALTGGSYKGKAVQSIDNLNDLVGTTSRNINLSVITKELVFKIPDQWNANIKPEHFLKVAEFVKKQLYPDFDLIYSTVHTDELSNHVHCRLSGKNKKTGAFDIQNQLLNRIRDNDHHNLLPKNKRYSELSKEEVKTFGELYQTKVFNIFHDCLEKLEYDFTVEKRSPEEKQDDSKKFLDKKRKSSDREYNLQNKLALENEKAQGNFEETNKMVNANFEVIKEQKVDIDANNKTIDSQKSFLDRLSEGIKTRKDEIIKYFSNLYQYAKTNDIKARNEAVDYHNDIEQQDEDISKLISESVNNELTAEKQIDYHETKKSRRNNKMRR